MLVNRHIKILTWDAVSHRQMKHWEESWKYDVQQSIFDELQSVSSGDETPCRMLDITSQTGKMILEWEIKHAKMSGFSSDFQTLIVFSIWIINEFRRCKENRNSVSNWVAYWFHMTTDLTTKHKVKFILPIGFLPRFSWSSKEMVSTSTSSSHFWGQGATRVHLKGKKGES